MTRAEKATRNEAMRTYNADHTQKETALKFGVTEATVSYVCRGIPRKKPKVYHGGAFLKGKYQDTEKIVATIEKLGGFEYAGNYSGTCGTADIRCKACGEISTRSWGAIRHAKVVCRTCLEMEKQRTEQEKAEAREAKRQEEERQRAVPKNVRQITIRFCKVCGSIYTTHKDRKIYCSEKCMKKANNAISKDKRIRRIRGAVKDKGITLEGLAEKCGDLCALCGTAVDWFDCETRADGTFVAGDNYPSIDHIIPLAYGGEHSWDNVQLAHRRCNYQKKTALPIRKNAI